MMHERFSLKLNRGFALAVGIPLLLFATLSFCGCAHDSAEDQGESYEAAETTATANVDAPTTEAFATWNADSEILAALTEYVSDVTDESSPNFIPVEDRIAVFDFDGTLYEERSPTCFGWELYAHRVLDDPDYSEKATAEQIETAEQVRGIVPNGKSPEGIGGRVAEFSAQAYAGMTAQELQSYAADYANETTSNYLNGITYRQAFFAPMVEVVSYLNDNGFTVYICSGTERDTIRGMVDGVLDVAPEHVIGTSFAYAPTGRGEEDGADYHMESTDEVVLTGELLIRCVKSNKVSILQEEIGRQPVLAFGNSANDISMATFTTSGNSYKSMAFMVLADDEGRTNGNAESAEKSAQRWTDLGWQCISTANDWNQVYLD